LGDKASFKPETVKIHPRGSSWAPSREKSITRTQKRNISHIWEQAPRKAIAMKFHTGVDIHDIVAWAEFDLENLRGVHFTGGGVKIWASLLTLPMGINSVALPVILYDRSFQWVY